MIPKAIFLAFIFPFILIRQQPTNEPADYDISVTHHVDEQTSLITLNISLKLTSQEEVEIYEDSLPWDAWHSMILVVTTPIGHALERQMPIDDPGEHTLSLRPGQTIKGEITLTDEFPELIATLQKHNLILFWSHQLDSIDAEPMPRKGGWLLIPKQATASAP